MRGKRDGTRNPLALCLALCRHPGCAPELTYRNPGTPFAAQRLGSLKEAFLADTISVNGTDHSLPEDPRVTLLDFLRHDLGLTGTKKGCDHGQCGACTVIVNGMRINSCLTLAAMHEGDSVTTIEGIGTPDAPSALQRAFLDHDGFQCGYCTPGQICSATAMIEELRNNWPSDATTHMVGEVGIDGEEIRERMSGNLCRCGAYANIVAAIRDAMAEESA